MINWLINILFKIRISPSSSALSDALEIYKKRVFLDYQEQLLNDIHAFGGTSPNAYDFESRFRRDHQGSLILVELEK